MYAVLRNRGVGLKTITVELGSDHRAIALAVAAIPEAIAVFEATLITPNGPFDRLLRGEQDALSPTQKAGLAVFMDKGCSACHNGINVGGGMYAPFGVVEKPGAEFLPAADKGRFMVSKTPSDE